MTEPADTIERLKHLKPGSRKHLVGLMRQYYSVFHEKVVVQGVGWATISRDLAPEYVKADGTPWSPRELARIWWQVKQERGEG